MSEESNIDKWERKINNMQSHIQKELAGKTGVLVLMTVSGYAKNIAHVDTGEMRNRIISKAAEINGNTVTYTVIAHAPHSVYEEYGTSRRKAHPFMRPALGIDVPADQVDPKMRNRPKPLDLEVIKELLKEGVCEVFIE